MLLFLHRGQRVVNFVTISALWFFIYLFISFFSFFFQSLPSSLPVSISTLQFRYFRFHPSRSSETEKENTIDAQDKLTTIFFNTLRQQYREYHFNEFSKRSVNIAVDFQLSLRFFKNRAGTIGTTNGENCSIRWDQQSTYFAEHLNSLWK